MDMSKEKKALKLLVGKTITKELKESLKNAFAVTINREIERLVKEEKDAQTSGDVAKLIAISQSPDMEWRKTAFENIQYKTLESWVNDEATIEDLIKVL